MNAVSKELWHPDINMIKLLLTGLSHLKRHLANNVTS